MPRSKDTRGSHDSKTSSDRSSESKGSLQAASSRDTITTQVFEGEPEEIREQVQNDAAGSELPCLLYWSDRKGACQCYTIYFRNAPPTNELYSLLEELGVRWHEFVVHEDGIYELRILLRNEPGSAGIEPYAAFRERLNAVWGLRTLLREELLGADGRAIVPLHRYLTRTYRNSDFEIFCDGHEQGLLVRIDDEAIAREATELEARQKALRSRKLSFPTIEALRAATEDTWTISLLPRASATRPGSGKPAGVSRQRRLEADKGSPVARRGRRGSTRDSAEGGSE